MDHGTFAAEGSPRELIERYCSPEVLELRFDPQLHESAADKLKDFPAERSEVLADRILLYVADGDAVLAAGMQASPLRPLDIFRGHLMFMTMRIAMNAAVAIVFICAFGAARSPWVVLAWPVAVLTGLAFAAPIALGRSR